VSRLDTALYRDGDSTRYVQDKMRQSATDLWTDGTYVCGDAARIARDLDETLPGLVAHQIGRSPNGAVAYLYAMFTEHCYVRDVY
jgi:sulfite reductase (NADPH) flavoprotein alpha-component